MAKGPHSVQTQGVDVLLCATVLVLEVRKADEYQTLPIGEKVGPPQAENVQPACTNPRCERRSTRETCSSCMHYPLLSHAELDDWVEQKRMGREFETHRASEGMSSSMVFLTGRNTPAISRSAILRSVRTSSRSNWRTGTAQKVEETGV